MATVSGGSASGGLNFDGGLDIGSLADGDVVQATTNLVQIRTAAEGGGYFYDNLYGSFTYNAAGDLTGGTITRWQETVNGGEVFDVQGVSVSVTTFLGW